MDVKTPDWSLGISLSLSLYTRIHPHIRLHAHAPTAQFLSAAKSPNGAVIFQCGSLIAHAPLIGPCLKYPRKGRLGKVTKGGFSAKRSQGFGF